MPCETKKTEGGGFAIICSRGQRPARRCVHCGAPSQFLCDFPVERNGTQTTCDRPLCRSCTAKLPGDTDLCRAHEPLWDRSTNRPKVGPGAV